MTASAMTAAGSLAIVIGWLAVLAAYAVHVTRGNVVARSMHDESTTEP